MISRSKNHVQDHGCVITLSLTQLEKNNFQTLTVLSIKNYGKIVVDSNRSSEVIRYINKAFIRERRKSDHTKLG